MNGKKKLGLIINPIAGIGGKAGLKGSDGERIQREALDKGIKPEAADKACVALECISDLRDKIEILTYEGDMGDAAARKCGFSVRLLGSPENPSRTSGADTERLAKVLLSENADLILFAGGDGTARNICGAIEDKIPVIGIPAGVKIHSGVYAVNPKSAGQAARQFLQSSGKITKPAEVMDIDEELYRREIVSPRLYGYMLVPDNKHKMQNAKMRSVSRSASLDYIATDVIQ